MAQLCSSWLRRLCVCIGGAPQADATDLPAADPIAMRAAALIDLAEGRLEVEGDAGGPETAWPMVGPALLVHATSRGLAAPSSTAPVDTP